MTISSHLTELKRKHEPERWRPLDRWIEETKTAAERADDTLTAL